MRELWLVRIPRGPRKTDYTLAHSRSEGSYRGLKWRLQVKCAPVVQLRQIAPFPAL
jgi:hypothetical protein